MLRTSNLGFRVFSDAERQELHSAALEVLERGVNRRPCGELRERSLAHAAATGAALSAIDPEYIGLLTLMLPPGTAMERRVASGELVLPDSIGMLGELREIVAHLDVTDCLFRCNHASNYLPVGGHLPEDKAAILASLGKVLEAPESVQLRPESWRLL